MLTVDAHPLLDLHAFRTNFEPGALARPTPAAILAMLSRDAPVPVTSTDALRGKLRDLLRHGGYKPTGRGKPAAEYLRRAAEEGALESINLAVDACNAVSLHSGLPISVVDLARTQGDLRVFVQPVGTTYVFNASGQTIDVSGLICLCDEEGPCASPVKDAHRTKTHEDSTDTLSVIWSAVGLEAHAEATVAWYRSLLESAGADTLGVAVVG